MISAILMMRRLLGALRVALRDEDFGRILSAAVTLIVIGTLAYSLGNDWSVVDGLYVAVATLTTSSVLDPELTITDPWLKVYGGLRAGRDRHPARDRAPARHGLHRRRRPLVRESDSTAEFGPITAAITSLIPCAAARAYAIRVGVPMSRARTF